MNIQSLLTLLLLKGMHFNEMSCYNQKCKIVGDKKKYNI